MKTLLPLFLAAACFAAEADVLVKSGEKIAFLGDSITQFGNEQEAGYVNLVIDGLARVGVKAVKIPAGVSGHKSDQMLARVKRDVIDKKPDWMLLSCGVNDVGHGKKGVELEPYKKNIAALLDQVQAAGIRPVVLTPTLCNDRADFDTSANNLKLRGYRDFLLETAAQRRLPVADLFDVEWRILEGYKTKPGPQLTIDHLHMNGYGNMMMAEGVLKALGISEEQMKPIRAAWRRLPSMTPFLNAWHRPTSLVSIEEYEALERAAAKKGQDVAAYSLGAIRAAAAAAPAATGAAPSLQAKILAKYPGAKTQRYAGRFPWTLFAFEGCEAWVIEPLAPAADNRWIWCMEWPTAFQDRTGVADFLKAGYRWVAFNPAHIANLFPEKKKMTAGNQNDEMVAKRRRFQKWLVTELNLAPQCGLVGMSWGGFYSVRYASIHPECVKAIYLDAPLLDFSTLAGFKTREWKSLAAYYPQLTADYAGADDPLQSVNRAEPIAKAGIPILLLYGGKDAVVPPAQNCERFAPRFEAAGGTLFMEKRAPYGHHPHGVEPNETARLVGFFDRAYDPPKAKK